MTLQQLTEALIACPSVTPHDAGCMDLLTDVLAPLGFTIHRVKFNKVDNFYARLGGQAPHFCFVGHTDVVPAGDESSWSTPPFKATLKNGRIYGRGITDMKGAIAAFVIAAKRYIRTNQLKGSLSLLLTSDEEGPACDGIVRMVDWLKERGETITACLVGEPTNPHFLGEMIKTGRRGSLSGHIVVKGKAGHSAYPHLAHNPIPPLLSFLAALNATSLDQGTATFDASHVVITSVDVGNPTSNVIPEKASARFNIRFNPCHTSVSLSTWLEELAEKHIPLLYTLDLSTSGEPFECDHPWLKDLCRKAIKEVCGKEPIFSTSGGTSDARFMKDICPVIEFGLISETAHQVDENVALQDLEILSAIYERILSAFFSGNGIGK